MAEETCGQALEPRHLGQRTEFRRKIGSVLRHAERLQCVRLLTAMVSGFAAEF
jgi:hypothetical protein